jgi:hypothetical protein
VTPDDASFWTSWAVIRFLSSGHVFPADGLFAVPVWHQEFSAMALWNLRVKVQSLGGVLLLALDCASFPFCRRSARQVEETWMFLRFSMGWPPVIFGASIDRIGL